MEEGKEKKTRLEHGEIQNMKGENKLIDFFNDISTSEILVM